MRPQYCVPSQSIEHSYIAEFFTAFIVEDVKFRGVAIGLELEKKCLPTGCEFCCLVGRDRVERIKLES